MRGDVGFVRRMEGGGGGGCWQSIVVGRVGLEMDKGVRWSDHVCSFLRFFWGFQGEG